MISIKNQWKPLVLLVLLFLNFVVFKELANRKPSEQLHVYFLDIGQGDSIFIDSPSHGRILLDGGPNKRVLTELGRILPFNDKRIDVVIESHPDKDHIGGLPEVINRFDVKAFMEPGVESPNTVDDAIKKEIKDKNIPDILARRGMVVDFGDGVKLEILFPNQDVSKWETNDASIVAKLIYGDKSFLLTGDSTIKAENLLMSLDKDVLKSTVLKAGHHGSHTSTSLLYAQVVAPEYAVISVGKDNQYGHPHKETIDTLNKIGAKIVSTEDTPYTTGLGTIEFITDGKTLSIK